MTSRDSGEAPYVPIACGFHDVLLDLATRRRAVEIEYRNEAGDARRVVARILDVYSSQGAEFMRLDSGDVVRLDRLLRAGDTPAPGGPAAGR